MPLRLRHPSPAQTPVHHATNALHKTPADQMSTSIPFVPPRRRLGPAPQGTYPIRDACPCRWPSSCSRSPEPAPHSVGRLRGGLERAAPPTPGRPSLGLGGWELDTLGPLRAVFDGSILCWAGFALPGKTQCGVQGRTISNTYGFDILILRYLTLVRQRLLIAGHQRDGRRPSQVNGFGAKQD